MYRSSPSALQTVCQTLQAAQTSLYGATGAPPLLLTAAVLASVDVWGEGRRVRESDQTTLGRQMLLTSQPESRRMLPTNKEAGAKLVRTSNTVTAYTSAVMVSTGSGI